MNHELVHNYALEPCSAEPLNRGAIVSKLILDRYADVVSATEPTTPSTWTTRSSTGARRSRT